MKAILFRNITKEDRELFEKIIKLTGNQVATTAIKDALSKWLEDRKKLTKAWDDNLILRQQVRDLEIQLDTQENRTKALKEAFRNFLKED